VIAVGIPFPNLKDIQVNLKRAYNNLFSESKGLLNGHQWYESQAFRATNQALGRCIRHKGDWGAIILLDQRYSMPKNLHQLSKWVRASAVTYKNFQDSLCSLSQFTGKWRMASSKHAACQSDDQHLAELSIKKMDDCKKELVQVVSDADAERRDVGTHTSHGSSSHVSLCCAACHTDICRVQSLDRNDLFFVPIDLLPVKPSQHSFLFGQDQDGNKSDLALGSMPEKEFLLLEESSVVADNLKLFGSAKSGLYFKQCKTCFLNNNKSRIVAVYTQSTSLKLSIASWIEINQGIDKKDSISTKGIWLLIPSALSTISLKPGS
jgi:Helicase C-terminal domain